MKIQKMRKIKKNIKISFTPGMRLSMGSDMIKRLNKNSINILAMIQSCQSIQQMLFQPDALWPLNLLLQHFKSKMLITLLKTNRIIMIISRKDKCILKDNGRSLIWTLKSLFKRISCRENESCSRGRWPFCKNRPLLNNQIQIQILFKFTN